MENLTVLELIEKDLKTLDMNLDDESWRTSVPSDPGWYFIETNAPPEVLKYLDPPHG